ncbi:ABC transporter permease [Gellertiella hungarica]|uniref:Autoinducer 2 import system permease protein LsrD n=1 Tax=Gellertiella hungarica TaxID=1572859 RepID=A0A7W6J352_9HYPH|nr:ABC transporter permease [Gellertiella hungarica]MBB4063874.1 fructose transport system permease protein [Gellertiella hungarica]
MSQPQEFEKVLTGSASNVAHFEEPKSGLRRLQHFLHSNPAMVPLIVLVALVVFFGIARGPKFFSAYTLTLIMQQVAVVGILAAAQTLVVLTAGIDLSIGVVMVFSFVVTGNAVLTYGLPAPLAILAGFGIAGLCGWVNGFLVSRLKLPPFIVTLGTWNIIMAVCLIYSENATLREADLTAVTSMLHVFGNSFKIGGAVVTLGVVAMILLYIALWYMLNYTAFGRHIYAVGDDPDAADLAGIRTKNVLLKTYALAGAIAGLAAWVSIGRNGSISPSTVVTDFNLQAITAAVIGGISLFGGRGSILGVLFGTLIVGVMSMGLNMLNADPQWKVLLTGVLIIGAVAIDQWIRKVSG